MSFKFGDIFSDLNSSKINPTSSNASIYPLEVQSWLWSKIEEIGLPKNCQTIKDWVLGTFSHDFKKEASRLWAINSTKGGVKAVEKKHQVFWQKPVEFPGTY